MGLVLSFLFFRHRRFSRFDFIIGTLASLFLLGISIYPPIASILRDILRLHQDQRGRLIALLVLSSILLWGLLLYTRMKQHLAEERFDRLVRALGFRDFAPGQPLENVIKPITVVIPAYEEEKNIGKVLKEMPREVMGKEATALVVIDGGEDNTEGVVKEAGFPAIRSPIHRGGGAALKLGFDIAVAGGAEIIVTMDADGQHRPEEIPVLVEPILAGEADMVIGSRILGRSMARNRLRSFGVRLFSRIINLLAATHISDCSSGFRAVRAEVLKKVHLRQDQYHTAELIIDAAKRGLRLTEAPITILSRHAGQSKKGKDWRYGLHFIKTILTTWWRP
ncbi:MAG: hypothetical protein AMS15_04505 [Planctomycetes bacterium DG_23]|nr:MAG: hypothetical protein AMS15_04505 [Planctomycetes bacterium DG_23]